MLYAQWPLLSMRNLTFLRLRGRLRTSCRQSLVCALHADCSYHIGIFVPRVDRFYSAVYNAQLPVGENYLIAVNVNRSVKQVCNSWWFSTPCISMSLFSDHKLTDSRRLFSNEINFELCK